MGTIYINGYRHIDLNKIQIIPCDVDQYYNVTSIEICHTKISILPVELFNLNLILLSLECNDIQILPREIKNLTNLYYLDLYDNKLSKLPKEIFDLKNIRLSYFKW